MDGLLLLKVIATAIVGTPLMAAILMAFAYRRYPSPPLLPVIVEAVMAFICICLLVFPPEMPLLGSLFLVAGAVVSISAWTALLLRRKLAWSFGRSMAASSAVLFICYLGFDYRFRVIARDRAGDTVDLVAGPDFRLHRPGHGLFEDYEYGRGFLLKRGTIYFGFLTWNRHRSRWTFWSFIQDKSGKLHGDLKWASASWSAWPKEVVLSPRKE